MEQFVLGIFQEHLAKYIIGFRKEQVNANILNGKGEIDHIRLNCVFLNEEIKKITPYMELESVLITKISFHVSSWTNLKKSPICIHIEKIIVKIVEPMEYDTSILRKRIRQITKHQLLQEIKQGLIPAVTNSSYNLLNRILDNLTIDIASVAIHFQTWGKKKTKEPTTTTNNDGPGTTTTIPPEIIIELKAIRFVSVDEYGNEGTPDEIWKHNHHRHAIGTYLIYKKLEMKYYVYLRKHHHHNKNTATNNTAASDEVETTTDDDNDETIKIISSGGYDEKLLVQLAMERRIKDAECMAIQLDAIIPRIFVDIQASSIPLIVQTIAGFISLVESKDMKPPTKSPVVEQMHEEKNNNIPTAENVVNSENRSNHVTCTAEDSPPLSIPEKEVSISNEMDADTIHVGTTSDKLDLPAHSLLDSLDDEMSSSSSSSSEDDDDEPVVTPGNERNVKFVRYSSTDENQDERPVLVLPNGTVIHTTVSLCVTLHEAIMMGTYSLSNSNTTGTLDYVEVGIKGCVVEAIWPKVNKTKGGYIQASISHLFINETYDKKFYKLVKGGIPCDTTELVYDHHHSNNNHISEYATFPMYEERSIRPDPLGIRYNVPSQTIGYKGTIDFIRQMGTNEPVNGVSTHDDDKSEQVQTLHEVSIDNMEILLDSYSIYRIAKFVLNSNAGGWVADSDESTPQETTTYLSHEIKNAKGMQPISSKLINATIRVSALTINLPAAVNESIRSSDLMLTVRDLMVNISSNLPRTLLDIKEKICFPNDSSDVIYSLADSTSRQEVEGESSIFRLQLTLRGLTAELVPSIPYCNARKPQQILKPTELTMIFSLESPKDDDNNNNIAAYVSVFSHGMGFNIDFDCLVALGSTFLVHAKRYKDLNELIIAHQKSLDHQHQLVVFVDPECRSSELNQNHRELTLILHLQVERIELNLWRQNVPRRSFVCVGSENNSSDVNNQFKNSYLPLLQILALEIQGVKVGLESIPFQPRGRFLFKLNVYGMNMAIVNPHTLILKRSIWHLVDSSEESVNNNVPQENPEGGEPSSYLVTIFSMGSEKREKYGLATRIQCNIKSSCFRSAAVDLNDIQLSLPIDACEAVVIQVLEALSIPAWSTDQHYKNVAVNVHSSIVDGSVGQFLLNLPLKLASLFRSCDQREVSQSSQSKPLLPASSLDRLQQLLTDYSNAAFLRVCSSNILLYIPASTSDVDSKSSIGIGISFGESQHLLGFSKAGCRVDKAWQNVAGRDECSWNDLMQRADNGLFHSSKTRQAIVLTNGQIPNLQFERVGDDFDINFAAGQSKVSHLECSTIDFLSRIEHLSSIIKDFVSRCTVSSANVTNFVKLYSLPETIQTILSRFKDSAFKTSYEELISTITSLKESLHCLTDKLLLYETATQRSIDKREKELKEMRLRLFHKEIERLSSLALVSCQVCGWIRIGTVKKSGIRGQLTTTLLPRWGVLRQSLLLVFLDPRQHVLIDIISLQDASLCEIAGGLHRHELKRSFSVVEGSGNSHFVVVKTELEYSSWIVEINRSIKWYSINNVDKAFDLNVENDLSKSLNGAGNSGLDKSFHSLKSENDSQRAIHFKPGFSRIVQNAKAKTQGMKVKGQAIVERSARMLVTSNTNLIENVSDRQDASVSTVSASGGETLATASVPTDVKNQGQGTGPNNPLFRNRFGGVGNITKRGFGAALQATKQKAIEINEKRRLKIEYPSMEDSKLEDSKLLSEPHTSQHQSSENKYSEGEKNNIIEQSGEHNSDTTQLQTADAPPDPLNSDFSNSIANCEKISPVNVSRALDQGERSVPETDQSGKVVEQADDASLVSEIMDESDDNDGRPNIRQKFGAAVRMAKMATQRVSSRRSESRGEWKESRLLVGAPEPMQVKNLSIKGPLYIPLDWEGDQNSQFSKLEQMEGTFYVKVDVESIADPVSGNAEKTYENGGDELMDPLVPTSTGDDVSSRMSNTSNPGGDPDSLKSHTNTDSKDEESKQQITSDIDFSIEIIQRSVNEDKVEKTFILKKNLLDIIALHTRISESITSLPSTLVYRGHDVPWTSNESMTPYHIGFFGLTTLDSVRLSGRLLGGLLQSTMDSSKKIVFKYHAEVVAEFLNSMISCPLPPETLAVLIDFLALTNVTTKVGALPSPNNDLAVRTFNSEENDHSSHIPLNAKVLLSDIAKLAEINLTTATRQSLKTAAFTNLAYDSKTMVSNSAPNVSRWGTPYDDASSNHFRTAMHTCLVQAMEERDEARTKLVSSEVLYTHQIEKHFKKVVSLTTELESLTNNNLQSSLKQKQQQQSNLNRYRHQNGQQDSDAELVSLCQQLAGEISARTSSELEIQRIKECHTIERTLVETEKQNLQDELNSLRKHLDQEIQEKNRIQLERDDLQRTCDELSKNFSN